MKLSQPLSYIRRNRWVLRFEGVDTDLWLLTPAELEQIPGGTVLTSINKEKKIVGVDSIDADTRFGYTAWGIYEEAFL